MLIATATRGTARVSRAAKTTPMRSASGASGRFGEAYRRHRRPYRHGCHADLGDRLRSDEKTSGLAVLFRRHQP